MKRRIELSNGPDKKERTKRNEHVGMQNGANFTIVSSSLWLVSTSNFTKSSQSSMYINNFFLTSL